jgi:hypothetical protein
MIIKFYYDNILLNIIIIIIAKFTNSNKTFL